MHGYAVETINRTAAAPLILRYEWLGNIGRAVHFIGLVSPKRDLQGVVCFGHGPSSGRPEDDEGKYGTIRKRIGSPALCLERGACVHYAPRNAASFLITHACRLICRQTGVEIFFAYADPMAGEYGGVYQAANWVYIGQGLDGRDGRSHRYFVLKPGDNPDNPANWRTSRELRRNGFRGEGAFDEARAQGWRIAKREAKHVYAVCVGRQKRQWDKIHPSRLYPAPRPELKRRT